MQSYLALLRGVNVGGNNMVKMADLRLCLEDAGFEAVKTYIQSGNVIFSAQPTSTAKLAKAIEAAIKQTFRLTVDVVVFSQSEWRTVIAESPNWWGKDEAFKHNILVLLPNVNVTEALQAIGELKPDIEQVLAGEGVLYQSVSWKQFGRATSGKLASKPIYKQMTVRNYNTATKLATLLQSD